ncbi:MAG TPA: TonB-dependent receptor plug domain-containing protein [Opitutus sp.]|nr:TonB-dependent receptor plug domain-containing protein [Opitutus sp.]
MKQKSTLAGALGAVAWLAFAMAPGAVAQNAPAATASPGADEDVVTLSPFTVNATEGQESYQVNETLAGSRVRTNLRDVGSAISVLSEKFLQDVNATDSKSLLQYTTNTEVGGLYGNFGGLGNTSQLTETTRLLRPNNDTRVRGLTSADNTRNYFLTDIPWDGYNVGRVDMQRGPNSMLFGVGSPAGIINTSLNDAMFRNAVKYENRFGSYGSMRNILDLNYELLPQELALRVTGLDDGEDFRQEPAYDHDKRIYAALRYDPQFLAHGSAHTSFKVNFERGIINANRPRELPPIDAITPWFLTGTDAGGHPELNKRTFNLNEAWRPNGVAGNNTPAYIPWFNEAFMGREFNADVGYVYNAGSAAPLMIQEPQVAATYGINSNGQVVGGIAGIPFARPLAIAGYNSYSRAAGLPGAQYNVYRDKSLSDPSIYDFYNHLIDGPNKHEEQDFDGLNLDLSQTFLDNRLAIDAAYYHERYHDWQESFLNDQQYVISVDINQTLADGSPNPNVGRPYVGNSGLYGNSADDNERDSWRVIGYGELRADDFMNQSTLTDVLGRHRFTAFTSQDTVKQNGYSWDRYATGQDWVQARGGSPSISDGDRQVDWITYLGPSLMDASSAANAHLQPVTQIEAPAATANVRYFDSHWAHSLNPSAPDYVDPAAYYKLPAVTQAAGTDPNDPAYDSTQSENPANYIGWTTQPFKILNADTGDIAQLYRAGAKRVNRIDSYGFTWQGFFWDDTIVGNFGWRHDRVKLSADSAPFVDPLTKVVDPFNYDAGPVQSVQEADTRSWSVVLHTPKFLRNRMPHGLDVSVFYNRGNNFEADTIRKTVNGDTIPNSTGKTDDYGFVISGLDNRVSFKVNWYKTTVKDATLEGPGAGIGGNLYYLYLLPAWAAGTAAIDWAGLNQGTINGHDVQGLAWYWDYANHDLNTAYGAQPRPAAAQASDQAERAMVDAFAQNAPSQAFFDAYQIPVDVAAMRAGDWGDAFPGGWDPVASSGPGSIQSASGGTIGGIAPVATVDTESKGIEFELFGQPLPNWNVTINAAKTEATRQNLGAALVDVINEQRTLWDSPAGDLRLWGNGGNTMRQYFDQNIYGPYLNLLAQEGTSAPEIRPWRANLVTSYTFTEGPLKNWTIGGADRWQQGEILGYGLDPTTELIDVSKPYRGPSENNVDLWIGYQRKLTSKIAWNIQLNVKDVGRTARLVPISVEPDGSPAAYRIEDGMTWQLTNRFSF